MRLKFSSFMRGAIVTVVAGATVSASSPDIDTDGDGLSDYQEVHKYFTNPHAKDSDGDGKPDGEWAERRDYTYSVRTVIRVMRPANVAAMNDDYQDARLIAETPEYLEIELVHYPFNTNAKLAKSPAVASGSEVAEALKPGAATFFDEAFRAEVRREAVMAGLRVPDAGQWTADDVRSWARWLLGRTRDVSDFTTYYTCFPNGKPAVFPGLEEAFRGEQKDGKRSVAEQFDREVLGMGMFRGKTRGACTSSAVYLATGLRAAGLPTRIVHTMPLVDASDAAQLEKVERGISLPRFRVELLAGLREQGESFSAHTFNEVWLDGRWRRLNYTALGDNITAMMGMLTHLNTGLDLSDLPLAETWGRRYAENGRSEVFRGSNPYTAREVDDLWGEHCALDRGEWSARAALSEVVVKRVYWFDSAERPRSIPATGVLVDDKGAPIPGAEREGHLLMTAGVSYGVLNTIYGKLDVEFTLVAEGEAPILIRAERGYWGSECYLRIPPREFTKLKEGVRYRLVPRNDRLAKWIVPADVTLTGLQSRR